MKKIMNLFKTKSNFDSSLSSAEEIVAIKSQFIKGSCINDKEVETRTDYIFYSNGNILLKSYRNNRLYSVSMMKYNYYLNKIISQHKQTSDKAYLIP
jgi:hypothetical protein